MKTKRRALIVVLILCFLLVACGSGKKSKVQDALQGTWSARWKNPFGDQMLYRYYIFKGDKYTTGGIAAGGEVGPETGKFEIKDSTIDFIPDDGSEKFDIDYSYNEQSGEVTLWYTDDIQLKKE